MWHLPVVCIAFGINNMLHNAKIPLSATQSQPVPCLIPRAPTADIPQFLLILIVYFQRSFSFVVLSINKVI